MERLIRWAIRWLEARLAPEEVIDLRRFGPFIECPRCECAVMNTELSLDAETLLPGMWVLDVTCVNCKAVYKSACPADLMVMEWAADVEEN